MVVVSIPPHVDFGPNYHQKDAPHFTFLYFEMPIKAFDRAFSLDGKSIFSENLKNEFLQSRSFFGLTIDVTCFCSGTYQVYYAEKAVFSKHLIFKVGNGLFRKNGFFSKDILGYSKTKSHDAWPIFKRKMADIESLRFLDISEKMYLACENHSQSVFWAFQDT